MTRDLRSRSLRIALSLGAGVLVALAAGASARSCACLTPPPRPAASAASHEAQALAAGKLARGLVDHARADRDALVMLAAARVLAREGIALVEGADAVAFGRVEPGAAPPRLDAAAALAEARILARGDQDQLAQIERFAAQADKGIVPQTLVYTRDLSVGRTMVMRAQAEGGRIALVRVRSDGDAALRIAVLDDAGKQACRAATGRAGGPGGEDLVCRWTPPRTGGYRIELTNEGPVWTRTILVSN